MNTLNNSSKTGKPPRIGYRVLSAILGVITLITFGTDRYLYETAGQSLGELPAIIMGGVLFVVGVGSFYASLDGHDIKTAILISMGPVGGLFVYLLGYHRFLPPSTDSPTSLIFLAFAGALLVIGTGAHFFGLFLRSVRTILQ